MAHTQGALLDARHRQSVGSASPRLPGDPCARGTSDTAGDDAAGGIPRSTRHAHSSRGSRRNQLDQRRAGGPASVSKPYETSCHLLQPPPRLRTQSSSLSVNRMKRRATYSSPHRASGSHPHLSTRTRLGRRRRGSSYGPRAVHWRLDSLATPRRELRRCVRPGVRRDAGVATAAARRLRGDRSRRWHPHATHFVWAGRDVAGFHSRGQAYVT